MDVVTRIATGLVQLDEHVGGRCVDMLFSVICCSSGDVGLRIERLHCHRHLKFRLDCPSYKKDFVACLAL